VITVDELREIKIRVRESGENRRKVRQTGTGEKRGANDIGGIEENEEQRSQRWKSLITGSGREEVQRLKDEAEERERYKLEEREEREREKKEGAGVTEEEREKEREARREKREPMKPASVRYMF